MFSNSDPWSDDHVAQSQKAIGDIARAVTCVRRHAPLLRGHGGEVATFLKDLEVILEAYRKDDAHYRANRAFTAVYLPAIVQSLESLVDLRGSSAVDETRLTVIERDLVACFRSARQVRSRVVQRAVTGLTVDIDVLGEAISPSAGPSRKQGVFDRAGSLVSRTVRQSSDAISPIGKEVLRRTRGGVELGGTVLTGYLSEGIDLVAAPISSRLSAVRDMLSEVSASAIVGGLLLTVIFPPAAPFAVGLALLEAPDLYADALKRSDAARQETRRASRAQRDEAIASALATVRGQGSIIRIETPCILVTMNVEDGTADGLVLAGRNTGRMLGEIDRAELALMARTAPDTDTRKVVESWISRNGDKT